MKVTWKRKWVQALRSGEYKQHRCYLRQGDSFCCLGVLCDVVDPNPWVVNSNNLHSYGSNRTLLPTNLRNRMGIGARAEAALANLNDDDKYDFGQIADWIEENL